MLLLQECHRDRHIVAASDELVHRTQEGHRDNQPESIKFTSDSGLYSITLELEKWGGLYYYLMDVFMVDKDPVCPDILIIQQIEAPHPTPLLHQNKRYVPVTYN